MKKIIICILLLLPGLSLSRHQVYQGETSVDVSALYDSLSHPLLEKNYALKMSDNFILRGGQGISLKDGILRLAAPVQGKRFVAVFSGNGTFTLALPTPLECAEFEQQTSNTLHHGSYLFTFKRAVSGPRIVYSQTHRRIPLSDQDVDRKEEEALDRSLKYATDKVNENVLFHLITERLEHNPQPYLFAHFFLMDGKEIFLHTILGDLKKLPFINPRMKLLPDLCFGFN